MNISKLIEIEAGYGFEDVNAIRESGIPSFMDEWVVTGLLGRGSYGNVYRIVKPQEELTANECALKICPVATTEDAELRRQEVETQQLLRGHPHAVQIEDYALISRQPPRMSYLLIRMELLESMPSDGLSEREVIRLGMDICSVLEKCASLQPKLIHCDIKPANILMTRDGRYKLGDFGMAKTIQASMTYTGNRGTPLYMAPEVASYTGYDSRCDIFSLGYTMLTLLNGGEHPWQSAGERADILRRMYEPHGKIRVGGVSSGLMKVLNRMCQPNLKARYSRASVVRRDLELLVRGREEAEREAQLRAERIAEQSRSRSKERHAREQALAQNALDKARSELEKAQNASGEKTDIRRLMDSVDRAERVQQYVESGLSYKAAQLRLAADSGEYAMNIYSGRLRRKRWSIAAAAAVTVLLCIGGVLLVSRGNDTPATYGDPAVEAGSSSENAPGSETITASELFGFMETPEGGCILVSLEDRTATEIAIPAEHNGRPVTEIGKFAFSGSNITRVDIPDSVKIIGENAFSDCPSLERVYMSYNIEVIKARAFKDCGALKYITLPENLREVHEEAFAYCGAIQKITLQENVSVIGSRAFMGCSSISRVYLRSPHIGKIPDGLFKDCSKLEKVFFYYGNSISEIGSRAFCNCVSLSEFNIPEGAEVIGQQAFSGAGSLESIIISAGVREIGYAAFEKCGNLASVKMEEGVTEISKEAFVDCTELAFINIPESVERIGENAFGSRSLMINAPHEASYYCDGDIGTYQSWIITK